MFRPSCKTLRFRATALLCVIAAGSATAMASAVNPPKEALARPITPALIERVKSALPQCKYGLIRRIDGQYVEVPPDILAPSVEAMGRKSAPELSKEEVSELYEVATRLMKPALSRTEGIPDALGDASCPPLPEDGTAIFEYLIAHGPNQHRGPSNTFVWLARAYESGAVGPPNPKKARSYHLRWAIHYRLASVEDWSDGIDDDLIANIERAGLRPYLEALARADHSIGVGSARMILAKEAIDMAPERARELLMYSYRPGLKLLLQYEEEGKLTPLATREEIAFWAGLRKSLRDYQLRERMLKGAEIFNDGPIPTQTIEPNPNTLSPYTNLEGLYRPRAIEEPVPIRVLVDTEGRAIHGETCQATPEKRVVMQGGIRQLTHAVRAYNVSTLPPFPVYRRGGRAVYSWVALPAITFEENEEGVLAPRLKSSPVEQCQFADIPDETQIVVAPPKPIR